MFFRSAEPHAATCGDNDEIAQLLKKPADKNQGKPMQATADAAHKAVPGATPTAMQGDEQRVAEKTTPADLTGIFRKVPSEQLEDLPSASGGNGGRAQVSPPGAGYRQAKETGEMTAGFTQIFQSLSPTSDSGTALSQEPMLPAAEQHPSGEARRSSANPEFRNPQSAREGEFTRLFQNLGHDAAQRPAQEQSMPTWSNPAPVSQSGGFTQLLRTLSAEEQEAALPPEARPIPSPYVASEPVSSGPGEFTRIISGSLLREAQGRTTPTGQARRSPDAIPAAEIPAPTPLPVASPAMPLSVPLSAPLLSPEQLVAPAPAIPAPAVLVSAPPASPLAAPQPQAPGKLQQYVPLLLIANLFVMVLILIAVVVVLLHR